jgi:adenylate cyclase
MQSREESRRNLGPAIGLIISISIGLLQLMNSFSRPELWTVDLRFALRGAQDMSDRVVLIDIDDQTLKDSGWPIARSDYASLIAIAAENGAKAVGFDLVLTNSLDKEDDALLGKMAKAAIPVIFPAEFLFAASTSVPTQIPSGIDVSGDVISLWQATGINLPIPPLLESTHQLAHVQFNNTDDGVYRKVPLVVAYGQQKYLSLGFQLALLAEGISNPKLAIKDGSLHILDSDIEPIPIDAKGTAIIGYRNVGGAKLAAYPLHTILDAYVDQSEGMPADLELKTIFKDKVVLVGPSAKSIGDLGPTPFFSNSPLVLAHVNTLDNVLTGGFVRKATSLFNFVFVLLIGMLVVVISFGSKAHFNALYSIGLAVIVLGFGHVLFESFHLQVAFIAPLLNMLVVHVSILVYNYAVRDKDERLIRQAFSRYVSPQILTQIVNSPGLLATHGEKKTITIMFSDIKGYTALSNEMPTDEVMKILNAYLNVMVEEIFAYDGTVDKIMGDGIMCFFGDPVFTKRHAHNAVGCAISMHKKLKGLQEKLKTNSNIELQTRIGIATGEVFVGNIGSAAHLEYTAIGAAVNLAARLEANGTPGQTTLSAETYHLIQDEFQCSPIKLELKGYSNSVSAYEVDGLVDSSEALRAKERQYEDMRSAARLDFSAEVRVEADGLGFPAKCLNISSGGMFLAYDNPLPKGTELAVIARLPYGKSQELYRIDAVVVRVEDESGINGVGMGVQFMQVTCESINALQHLLDNIYGKKKEVDAKIVKRGTDTFGREVFKMRLSKELENLVSSPSSKEKESPNE